MTSLSETQVHEFIDEFYTVSLGDIVGLFAIAQAVENLSKDDNIVREEALRVVNGLLDEGMLAGTPPIIQAAKSLGPIRSARR